MMRVLVFLVVSCTVAPIAFEARADEIDADESDARVIMEAVEARDRGDRMSARMRMTITDGSGRQRVRIVQSRSMEFDEGVKQLLIFEKPADVRNTGLLTIDYDEGDKADDQWLYLPSVQKPKRIASDDKSGSFMGSDISYSDMTQADPDDYEYTVVKQSTTVDGEKCWLIEARPKEDVREKLEQETGYLKTHFWISKSKLVPVQAQMWIKSGRRIKQMKFDDIRLVENAWIPHEIKARTLRGEEVESVTVLEFADVVINDPDVQESDFTLRRLEQGL